jgi:hypothetical protein
MVVFLTSGQEFKATSISVVLKLLPDKSMDGLKVMVLPLTMFKANLAHKPTEVQSEDGIKETTPPSLCQELKAALATKRTKDQSLDGIKEITVPSQYQARDNKLELLLIDQRDSTQMVEATSEIKPTKDQSLDGTKEITVLSLCQEFRATLIDQVNKLLLENYTDSLKVIKPPLT